MFEFWILIFEVVLIQAEICLGPSIMVWHETWNEHEI